MTSKPLEVWVPITELHYVGWAKIRTNGHIRKTQTDVITQVIFFSAIQIKITHVDHLRYRSTWWNVFGVVLTSWKTVILSCLMVYMILPFWEFSSCKISKWYHWLGWYSKFLQRFLFPLRPEHIRKYLFLLTKTAGIRSPYWELCSPLKVS